jgi:hypothetical protein
MTQLMLLVFGVILSSYGVAAGDAPNRMPNPPARYKLKGARSSSTQNFYRGEDLEENYEASQPLTDEYYTPAFLEGYNNDEDCSSSLTDNLF